MQKVLLSALIASFVLTACGGRPARPGPRAETDGTTTTDGTDTNAKYTASMMSGHWQSVCESGDVLGRKGSIRYDLAANPGSPKLVISKSHYTGRDCSATPAAYIDETIAEDFTLDGEAGTITLKGNVQGSISLNSKTAVSRAKAKKLKDRSDWKKGKHVLFNDDCTTLAETCTSLSITLKSLTESTLEYTNADGVTVQLTKTQ